MPGLRPATQSFPLDIQQREEDRRFARVGQLITAIICQFWRQMQFFGPVSGRENPFDAKAA